MTGTLNTLAALASPITLLKRSCRSMDVTPKVICGWWSIKITVQFCGVSRLWMRLVGAGVSAIAHSFEWSVDVSGPGWSCQDFGNCGALGRRGAIPNKREEEVSPKGEAAPKENRCL